MPGRGASGRRSPREWLPALILALSLASTAGADVVVQQQTVSVSHGGPGNGTISRTMIVAGDPVRSTFLMEGSSATAGAPSQSSGKQKAVVEEDSFDVPAGYRLQKTE